MPIEMDYTNRDYESIRAFLVAVAREKLPEWVTAGEPADMGTLLLELFAYTEDVTNFYIDRAAAEAFLRTAVRRQSVLAIGDLLNYKPVNRQAASTVLTFSLEADTYATTNVTVPDRSLVKVPDRNDIVYETQGALTLGQAVRSGTVMAYEGRTYQSESVGFSTGAPLQVFPLLGANVIERSLYVEVEEATGARTVWTYTDYLADAAPDASVYTSILDDVGNVMIRFGDNVHGRIPTASGGVFVTYRVGAGAAGNMAEGMITEMVTPIPGVSVTNLVTATGGADPESLDQLRESIPRATRVLDRAVTLQDYADLAFQVPGIAKAVARGDYYTNIFMNVAPVGGGQPNQGDKDRVKTYIEARSIIGVTLQVDGPYIAGSPVPPASGYLEVVLTMDVYVRHEYGQLSTKQQVEDALNALFSFEQRDFGEKGRVSLGDIYMAAQSPVGVAYVIINQFHVDGQANPSPLVDIVPPETSIVKLKPDTGLTLTMYGGLV